MTNRLINETSPYLLQHAENPVDWYAWSEEALQRAKDEDRPIFLSVGYAACHWCHVMAHESFEDPEIAEIMNESFINIKVDREERPDLDSLYMEAVVSITAKGDGQCPFSSHQRASLSTVAPTSPPPHVLTSLLLKMYYARLLVFGVRIDRAY